MIYLDYSANTPADEDVIAAFAECERSFAGNANSNHIAGLAARERMALACERVAAMLGVQPSEVIFTSGASEANNTAIKGIAHASRRKGRHIISTYLEHSSVSGCLTVLQEQGWDIDLVDITREGKIDLEHLKSLIRADTVLVAVTAVDSELGTVQPIGEIAKIVAEHPNCRLHVDMTQAVGKIPLSLEGVDTAAIAPHKFYGLNGVGVLIKRRGLVIEPLIHGGASTTVYRSGTPALSLAVSAEKALQTALGSFSDRLETVKRLNARLRAFLESKPDVRLNSPADAVPHILNLSVNGIKGTVFQRTLSEKGICVSVKSACSTDGTPSRAVFAVSRDRRNALSSWRISLSHLTTDAELDEFEQAYERCCQELK